MWTIIGFISIAILVGILVLCVDSDDYDDDDESWLG